MKKKHALRNKRNWESKQQATVELPRNVRHVVTTVDEYGKPRTDVVEVTNLDGGQQVRRTGYSYSP